MKRLIVMAMLAILLVAGFWGYQKYRAYTDANVPSHLPYPYLLVPTGSSVSDLVDSLAHGGFLKDASSFREYAQLREFTDEKVKPGRYRIQEKWSNHELLLMLLQGNQATINMTLNGARQIEDVAAKAARYLEPDSASLIQYILSDAAMHKYSYNRYDALTYFVPNTYNFYWTTSPNGFVDRMMKEHERFWKQGNRTAKAQSLGLTQQEVYTLASIVEKETRLNAEMPTVAGLYLNRLRKNMLLQADPTAVFATGDFAARRVLNKHIEFDSPYNTYKYAGLPPGPITMPSIAAIDAVLHPAEHDYLFMCAKPGYSGEHAFARSSYGHAQNANRYRSWLNSEGIMR